MKISLCLSVRSLYMHLFCSARTLLKTFTCRDVTFVVTPFYEDICQQPTEQPCHNVLLFACALLAKYRILVCTSRNIVIGEQYTLCKIGLYLSNIWICIYNTYTTATVAAATNTTTTIDNNNNDNNNLYPEGSVTFIKWKKLALACTAL